MDKNLSGGYSTDLPYDLRQIYAVELVGEHLKDVAKARKADNYQMYYKTLNDLWIVIQHKVKGKDLSHSKEYDKKRKVAVLIFNKYPQEYLGQSKNPVACSQIEQVLNDIEMFLYDMIEKAKMFGANSKIPGL